MFFLLNDTTDRSVEIVKKFFEDHTLEYNTLEYDVLKLDAPLDSRTSIRRQIIYKNLAFLRNKLIDYFLEHKEYDYYFSIDSDILVFPQCLEELLKEDKDIISAMISNNFNDPINLIPNAMIKKPDGSYIRIDIKSPDQVLRCDLTGAVCLIARKVFESGVRYGDDAMGEDRIFCDAAISKGFTLWTKKGPLSLHCMKKMSPIEGSTTPEI